MTLHPRAKKTIAGILLFCFCLAMGFLLGSYNEKREVALLLRESRQIRLPNEKYPLVNRLIGADIAGADKFGMYAELQEEIGDFIAEQVKTTSLTKLSFYFRDLNSGLWFGINEDEEFVPASLFKLPIAIAYYKDTMNDSAFLDKTYEYTSAIDSQLDTQIGLEKSELVVGHYYTVEDLIRKMLIDSDNGAKNLLTEHINVSTLNDLFRFIDLPLPKENNYYLSPKQYSFFLRILYNGNYLGQERSQAILSLLSQTNFNQGIRKVVPQEFAVVHKFGLLTLADKKIGFRDCGIVYYTSKPFIVCIMATGDDQQELVADTEMVTEKVFKYVKNN